MLITTYSARSHKLTIFHQRVSLVDNPWLEKPLDHYCIWSKRCSLDQGRSRYLFLLDIWHRIVRSWWRKDWRTTETTTTTRSSVCCGRSAWWGGCFLLGSNAVAINLFHACCVGRMIVSIWLFVCSLGYVRYAGAALPASLDTNSHLQIYLLEEISL